MSSSLLKLLGLLALAGVKLFYSAPVVLAAHYTFRESVLILMTGGFIGVLVFFFFGGALTQWFSRKWIDFTGRSRKKKSFTWTNRTIVRVKKRTGIIGIAFITPVILSIPLGSIVAYTYFGKDKRTLPALLISVVFWSFISVLFWGVFF